MAVREADPTMESWRLGEGIDERAAVAEGEAGALANGAGFDQRIGHARGFAHGFDGLANALGGDAGGAQGAQSAQLGEVFKRIVFAGGNETRLLPCSELAAPQMENSKNVLTAVSGHVWVSTGTVQWSCWDF
jgi:hypothetical protein